MMKGIIHNLKYFVAAIFSCMSFSTMAVPINWTDWTSESTTNGYTATGSITSGSETIGVTYTNARGILMREE